MQLKQGIANYILKKRFSQIKREKKFLNFNQIQSVYLLCEYKNEKYFRKIKEFSKSLKLQGKRVQIICYLDMKELPDNLSEQNEFVAFSKKELNILGIPKKDFSKDILEQRIDLMIQIVGSDSFQVKYFSLLSSACFKVGIFSENNDFDFMIETEKESDIDEFTAQLIEYLKLINSNK